MAKDHFHDAAKSIDDDAAEHGPLCFDVECLPHEATVTVQGIDGRVHEVPRSEAPEF